jgi:hypothetical protein
MGRIFLITHEEMGVKTASASRTFVTPSSKSYTCKWWLLANTAKRTVISNQDLQIRESHRSVPPPQTQPSPLTDSKEKR